MHKKINIEILVQVVLEFFISLILAINLLSGRINTYIHPKFNILIWVSSIILMILAGYSSRSIYRSRHMCFLNKYIPFIIPLILLIYVKGDINPSYMQINTQVKGKLNDEGYNDNIEDFSVKSESTVYKRAFGKNYIEIDDDSYLKWYYDSCLVWEKYEGERFKILVKVFKKGTGTDQYVVLGRLGMICCIADLRPCGFIYMDEGFRDLKDGSWYYITGKIKNNEKNYSFNGEKLPIIFDVEFEKAIKPANEYVYIR